MLISRFFSACAEFVQHGFVRIALAVLFQNGFADHLSGHLRFNRKVSRVSKATIVIEALPVIRANEGQLLRLFQNLIGNAIKYRGENTPEILIAASSTARGC